MTAPFRLDWHTILGPPRLGQQWVYFCPCGQMDVMEQRPEPTCSKCGAEWILNAGMNQELHHFSSGDLVGVANIIADCKSYPSVEACARAALDCAVRDGLVEYIP